MAISCEGESMTHQRKSELNRFISDGVMDDIPYGVPSDDLHPDGEPHPDLLPPRAQDEAIPPKASIDWGEPSGEEIIVHSEEKKKKDKAA